MRTFGRIALVFAKIVGVLALVLVVLLGVLAGLVVYKPEALINDRTLSLAQEHVLPRLGITATWKDASLDVASLDRLDKRITISFTDLDYKSETIDFAATRAAAVVDVSLRWAGRRLTGIGPITVDGGELVVRESKEEKKTDEKPLDLQTVVRFFDGRRLDPIAVELVSVQLPGESGASLGTLVASLAKPAERHFEVSVAVDGKGKSPLPKARLTAAVGLHEAGEGVLTPSFDARLDADMRQNGIVNARFVLEPPRDVQTGGRALRLDARYDGKSARVETRLTGLYDREGGRLSGQFDANVHEVAGQKIALELTNCRYDARSADFLDKDVSLALSSCRGLSKLPIPPPHPALSRFVPKKLAFALAGNLRMEVPSKGARRASFDAGVELDGIRVHPVSLDGKAGVEGRLSFDDPGNPESLLATYDVEARISAFETLVKELKHTALAVPAPANQLKGRIACAAKGKVDLVREAVGMPLGCNTDLASPMQSLVTTTTGNFKLVPVGGRLQPILDADVTLTNVQIVLPDLSMKTREVPRLVADKRIALPTQEEVKKLLPIRYTVKIHTPKTGSLRIASNLVKAPIPLGVNIGASSERGVEGDVAIGHFDVEMFRRTAHVEGLKIGLAEGGSDAPPTLDGRVRFDSNDYRIYVDIIGTTEKPRYVMYSEPPLPERDVIAVLLFGRKPELLDEDAVRTAEETRAAIADSAISLVTMYYLASTPVESVGYNPHTGMLTAKVKLQEGLSLEVGKGAEEEAAVGLRKRIGRNWSVETRAESNQGEDNTKGVAMLRWGRRY